MRTVFIAATMVLVLLAGARDAGAEWTPDTPMYDVKPQVGGDALYRVDDEMATASVVTRFEPASIAPGQGFVLHMEMEARYPTVDGFEPLCEPASGQSSEPYLALKDGADWWNDEGGSGWALWWDTFGELDMSAACTSTDGWTTRTVTWTHTVPGSETEAWDPGCFQAHTDTEVTQFSTGTHQTGSVATLEVGAPAGRCASTACSADFDDDGDGLGSWPFDSGCRSLDDPNEHDLGFACDDGLDNDRDGYRDFRVPLPAAEIPSDPGCRSMSDPNEADAACSDGEDNDGDGRTDFAEDHGCSSEEDGSEDPEPECSDGRHNDSDGLMDMADPGCSDPRDDDEYREVTLIVEIDGPGTVRNEMTGDTCRTTCVYKVDAGTRVPLRAQQVTDDGFLGWDSCGAFTGPSCLLAMDRHVLITARFDPITGYAPWMSFHPDEKRWPMDPATFIRRSSLVWMPLHPRDCQHDPEVKVKRGKVDATKLGSGGYTERHCRWRYNRRARVGKEYETWDTRDYTSPSRKPRSGSPRGRTGFVLDLHDGAYTGTKPKKDHGPPMYVEYEPDRYVIYWFFYGHNNVTMKGGTVKDKHEGDWEHLVVRLDDENRAEAAAYYQHYCGGDEFTWAEMERKGFLTDGTHPKVYVAKGAHASYPNTGFKPFSCSRVWKGAGDKVKKGPVTWRTWARGSDGFRRADAQPWYGFGGGWGDIADSTTHYPGPFWGPLGPGPLKFQDGALPEGW